MSNQRSGVLELAVLGILHETPMHGYELRKRLNSLLGKGVIAEDSGTDGSLGRPLDRPRRSKIVYRLTAEGKERLNDLLGESGPSTWEDDGFGVHFRVFGLHPAA